MKAAIVDMDGTILDSLGMWSKIDREFLEEKRGISVPEDYVEKIAPMTYRETADYTIARFGLPDDPLELMEEWEQMALHEYQFNVGLKPYARRFLTRLRAQGIKTVLCTSSPKRYYAPALTRLGIYDLFDSFTTTSEVGAGKDMPDVFLLAAEKVRTKPEDCVAFDDIPEAILGAKKAGMVTCGVYDEQSKSKMDYMRSICDRYILNLEEFFN